MTFPRRLFVQCLETGTPSGGLKIYRNALTRPQTERDIVIKKTINVVPRRWIAEG